MLVGGLIGDVYTVVSLFDLMDVCHFCQIAVGSHGKRVFGLIMSVCQEVKRVWKYKARCVADVLAAANN